MSLFGAMNTAISGLTAQSAAFTNISDNVANSQTIGFKGIDTDFTDYLTSSTRAQNQSGSVVATPDYRNDAQGAVQQSSDPTALAITGRGFFQVSTANGTNATGQPILGPTAYFTRAGDFRLDANGYLVNSAGGYLNGWQAAQPGQALDTSQLVPLRIPTQASPPLATSNVALVANVPATPGPSSLLSSQIQVYDSTGSVHQLQLSWAPAGADSWTLSIASPDQQGGPLIGTATVNFNSNGTLASLANATGSVTAPAAGAAATLQLAPNFGQGTQAITLNLGTFNAAGGVTQYAGTDYALSSITQDGAPPGAFTGIATNASGDIIANYTNGRALRVAHVPLVTFQDPGALQRQNGQSFSATSDAGVAVVQTAGNNGAGTLVTSATENANVDIATELSKLIVAQQAYGANAKTISTAEQMLATTVNIKQ